MLGLYAITGTLNIGDLAARIADIGGSAALYAGFGFMIAGIMVKAAVSGAYLVACGYGSAICGIVFAGGNCHQGGALCFGAFAFYPVNGCRRGWR